MSNKPKGTWNSVPSENEQRDTWRSKSRPKADKDVVVNNTALENWYRAKQIGDPDAGRYLRSASVSDADVANWKQWRNQNAGQLDVEYTMNALDQDVLSRVADKYKSQWGDKQYYDLFDPEDAYRLQTGAMPKYLTEKYDLNDPYDQYLLENNLPYRSMFNDMYSEAYKDYEEEQTNRYNRLSGFANAWDASIDSYEKFQNDFVNNVNEARKKKGDALTEREMEDLTISMLTSGRYDDVASRFTQPTEEEDKDELTLYIEQLNKPDYSVYDNALTALQNGEDVDEAFYTSYKDSDYQKWFAQKTSFTLQNLIDAYDLSLTRAEMAKYAEYYRAVEKEDLTGASKELGRIKASVEDRMNESRFDKANQAYQMLLTDNEVRATDTRLTPFEGEAFYTELKNRLDAFRVSDKDSADFIDMVRELDALNAEGVRLKATEQQDANRKKLESMTAEAKEAMADPSYEPRQMEGTRDFRADSWLDDFVDENASGFKRLWQNIVRDLSAIGYAKGTAELTGEYVPYDNPYTDPKYFVQQYMTDEEKNVLNYYRSEYGDEKAKEYLEALIPDLYLRDDESMQKIATDAAGESKLVASILPAFAQLHTFGEGAGSLLVHITGEKVALNDPGRRYSRTYSQMRQAVASDMSPTGQFFYQTGMSMLDSLARLPLGHAGLGVMAGSVFAQSTDQALQNGATPDQAVAIGAAAAVIEVVTEKVSLDNLFEPKLAGSAGQIVRETLKQAGIEASEEMASEILNIMADVQIMGMDSEWEKLVQYYMQEGLSRQQAESKAFGDKAIEVMLAGAGGFLSGGVMGGGNVMLSNYITGLRSGGNAVNALSVGTKAIGQYQQDLQTYGKLASDTITDTIKDISSLPLDAETKKSMIGDASAIANQPANHIPQAVAASYRQSIDTIKTAANRARTIGADYTARKAKVTARLTRMLDTVVTARSEAEAALNRGDLNAHHAAIMKAQKAMEDYRAEYSVAEAETAALQAKQTEQEAELANGVRAEAANLRTAVEQAATWQDKLMVVRDHLSDQEWNAMSLEEQEAMVDATITQLDSEFDQDQIAANMADAFMRGDQADAEFWESMLYHDLTPDSTNDTVIENQAEGEADGRDSISRTESDLAQDARRGEEQNAGRESRDGAQTSGTNQSAWGARQEQDVTNAVAEYNRTHTKQMPVGSIRKAGKISEAVQKVADYIKGITGRDSFFVESDTDLIGGFQTNDRRYVVYTGDPMTDLFNLAHENGHSNKDFLDIIYAALDSGEIPSSSFQAYVRQRTENIARKQGIPASRVNESQDKLREEFACDMFGLYMVERYFGTANWNQYGIPESSRTVVRNAFDAVLPGSQRNTSRQNGRASERTADDELYDALLRNGSAISEQDAEGVNFSYTSMLNDMDDYRQDLIDAGLVGRGKAMSNAELNTLFNVIGNVMDVVGKHSAILDYAIGVKAEDRAYSPYKSNADPHYKVALDFSTLCRKRILLQTISERLQSKLKRNLTAEEQIAIRNELKRLQDEGKRIEVACALCYVEAARLKTPKVVNAFLENRAQKMTDYFAKKNSDFMRTVRAQQEAFKLAHGYDSKATKKQMSPKDRAAFNKLTPQLRSAYQPSEREAVIIRQAEEMDRSRFLSSESLTRMATENPEIYDAFVSTVRSATRSKAQETRVPYYRGDIYSVSQALIEEMNEESGFRHQSWSDFETIHLLDDIAAVIEMSTRRAKMHTYTKVPNMVRVNGLTNMMINMSLIPAGDTGLNQNGELDFDPVEGMPYEQMKELRELYSDVAGSIAIGINDQQILKLLSSEFIDYVIPYHTSGLNKTLRAKMGIRAWANYTDTQNEKPNGRGEAGNAPSLREWFNATDGARANDGTAYMVKASRRYLELCHERNLVPKFPQFLQKNSDGSYSLRKDAQNYWKLLIDRKMVDQSTNKVIDQKPVLPIFEDGVLQDILQQEIDNPSHGDDEEVADYIVNKVERGELAISKAAKQEYKALRERQALDAINAASGEFNFSENAPTRQSRLNDARELYDNNSTPAQYYASNPQGFDLKTSNLLRGLMLRNGENVGGALSDNTMERIADIFSRATHRHSLPLSISSPVRVFEDVTGWGGSTAEERAQNVRDGNYLKNTYYEYGNIQAANRETWIAEKMQPVIDAVSNNGEYGALESSVTQMLGEGIITEEQARNAVSNGKVMIIEAQDGVFVLDGKSRLLYSSDGETTTEYTEDFRERMKRALKNRRPGDFLPQPKLTENPLSVSRDGNTVTVKDANGKVVAEVTDGQTPNMAAVNATMEALRTFYKDAYSEISAVRLENGYAPPGYIENYFPHQSRTFNGIEGFIEAMSANELPTSINGLTGQFTPGQPWNANLQTRLGTYTEFDAIRGFNRYVNGSGDTIFYTPVIQRLRQLERALRTQGDAALSQADSTRNSAFVNWVHEYANEFANKKSTFDRGVESFAGREAYSVSQMLTRLVSASAVGGNVSSSLSNFISALTGYSQIDAKHTVPEAFRTIGQLFQLIGKNGQYDGFADKIPFLKRRFSGNEDILIQNMDKLKRKGSKALYAMFSAIDRFAVESVARAKYTECLDKGMSETQAIAATNDMLIKNFADRGKGQSAQIFNIKWLRPFAQFQLEVLNQMYHFRDMNRAEVEAKLQDLEREYGEGVPFADLEAKALSSGGIRKLKKELAYLVLLSLWGLLTREAMGRDQTWNPYGMAKDFAEDFQAGGLKQAGEGLMEAVIDNTPFASMLSGGGRVPIAGNLANVTNIVETLLNGGTLSDVDLVKAGTSFVPGGGQFRKSYQGAKANAERGKYTNDGRLQYPVTEDDFWKTVLFGASAAQPSDYEWGDTLSKKETEVYKELVSEGYDEQMLYDTLVGYGGSTNAERALSLLANRNDFTDEEIDVIAEMVGLNYNGSLERYAEKETKKYLRDKERELESGEITQERFDEIENLFDEYFRLLGMN